MRKEIAQYHLDWMLWSIFSHAAKLEKSTPREIDYLEKYVPHFSNILSAFRAHDEVGFAILKMLTKYLENILLARSRGKKIAVSTFCFCPAILYAMDVVPITLEILTVMSTLVWKRGTADYLDYCVEIGFTETSCSSQRGSLGAYLAGLGEEIDFILIDSPGVCDTNANAYAFAAAYLDKPFYQLNMPSDLTSDRSRDYHRQDFKAMIRFIEQQTGNALDRDHLRSILKEIRVQDEIINEIEELQMMVPNPAPVEYSFFIYSVRFLFAGMKEGTRVLRKMLAQIRSNAEKKISGLSSGREKVRSLFCYIDHYTTDLRLWQMLDRNGITHIGNILSRSWSDDAPLPRYLENENESYRIVTDDLDGMIDTMGAINARMPMVKSIRGPYDSPNMWLEDNMALAKLYDVDCIIYNGTPGCRNTWGMVKLFARDMENYGFPTHLMYADAFDDRVESWESTESRFEEFLTVRGLLS
jgi:benzoyl-CoA reductase/2-hydroxyglutaryl-CoA dehydratase subunit BcrC/BadD/HgdB